MYVVSNILWHIKTRNLPSVIVDVTQMYSTFQALFVPAAPQNEATVCILSYNQYWVLSKYLHSTTCTCVYCLVFPEYAMLMSSKKERNRLTEAVCPWLSTCCHMYTHTDIHTHPITDKKIFISPGNISYGVSHITTCGVSLPLKHCTSLCTCRMF